jgi:N-dimethylarginine dimethylaminohydrolase
MTLSGTVTRFLMCQPTHFAVKYVINPWMNPVTWARNERSLAAASRREWQALRETLRIWAQQSSWCLPSQMCRI